MARRVFLHIGTMKSASSYVQELFDLNVDYLTGAGILWPSEELRYQGLRERLGRPARETDRRPAWPVLARLVRQHPGDVIISNELLAALGSREVSRVVTAMPGEELHVVVTARDLSRVMPSHWQTTLKNGGTDSWTDFGAAICTDEPPDASAERMHGWFWRRHDVPQIIERWRRVVPAERISLITVPVSGGDPSAVAERFGSVVGVRLTGLTEPAGLTNASLGAHSAELLRRLNLQRPDMGRAEQLHGLRKALGAALAATGAELEPRFALSQAQQEWVRGRGQRMIAELERDGVRVEGALSDLLPQEHPPSGAVDPAASTAAELLRAAERGLAGMVTAVAEARLELNEVSDEVERLQNQTRRDQQRIERLKAQRPADRGRWAAAKGRARRLLRKVSPRRFSPGR